MPQYPKPPLLQISPVRYYAITWNNAGLWLMNKFEWNQMSIKLLLNMCFSYVRHIELAHYVGANTLCPPTLVESISSMMYVDIFTMVQT